MGEPAGKGLRAAAALSGPAGQQLARGARRGDALPGADAAGTADILAGEGPQRGAAPAEIWLDLAEEFHHHEDWPNLFWACTNGIDKTHRTGSYLDDENSWSYRLFDLGAIACWHLNVMDRAVDWGNKALAFEPGNERLRTNLDFFVRRRDEIRAGA